MNKELKMEKVTDGIYRIETYYMGYEGLASCYLMEDNGELAFVENNTNYCVPLLLEAVTSLGFTLEQVKYVIVTHIHLDHAGGTGLLMQKCPNATLVVHGRGRKHMANPEKLIEGVKHVYGEQQYHELYGEILPVEKSRIHTVVEKDTISLGKRELYMEDSPGHAKHHMFIYDKKNAVIFSGDAFGIAYPRFVFRDTRLAFPSTSPVQFEPDRALESYEKMRALLPKRVLLTHFGCLEDDDIYVAHNQLKEWIAFSVEIAGKRYAEGLRDNELSDALFTDLTTRLEGCFRQARGSVITEEERKFLFTDFNLNAKGIAHYITKLNEKE
ncbi:MAG: MBL fold metallo-hydrolase [bacterium]|nr:MBL fold metallo-hydrolase [bacterium]